MKFLVSVDNKQVLLSPAQMEILTTALSGAEVMFDLDVGKGNGDHGYADQYIYGIKALTVRNNVTATLMDDDEYEAIKFVTKQHAEKKV